MLSRTRHKSKDIEEVLQYAELNGWIVEVHAKSKSHAWGVMKCLNNDSSCWNGIYCSTSIWSTPKNAQNHAKQLKRVVDRCIYKEDN